MALIAVLIPIAMLGIVLALGRYEELLLPPKGVTAAATAERGQSFRPAAPARSTTAVRVMCASIPTWRGIPPSLAASPLPGNTRAMPASFPRLVSSR
ncbi:hypothetical protein [Streptomyces sp. SLBN-118]|uniref:hypothetical protein n=1 Tax=Streptomyces sp. SLBN-118 TaxID=2768454 RepID=UPI00114E2628|nr:hypothetical protein [Streptomyces sp. SLBN-118]